MSLDDDTTNLLLGKARQGDLSLSTAWARKEASNEMYPTQVSIVQGPPEGIKSQWQAGFLQIFPLSYSELPYHHKSDAAFFEKYWKGDPRDMTFEEFLERTRHNKKMEKTPEDAGQN